MPYMSEPKTIWLQPWCGDCARGADGRQWCEDDIWEPCEECGAETLKYMLDAKGARRERDALALQVLTLTNERDDARARAAT